MLGSKSGILNPKLNYANCEKRVLYWIEARVYQNLYNPTRNMMW